MTSSRHFAAVLFAASSLLFGAQVLASSDGAINGTVLDSQGIAVGGAKVQVLSPDGKLVKEATSSVTGEFQIFPLVFGDYRVTVQNAGSAPYTAQAHVASGGSTQVNIQLEPAGSTKEIVVEVKAKKHLIQTSAAQSSTSVNHEQIEQLPQGNQISLPRLLETTSPGVVAGPFNQVFIRGNHANIQYQIDGIQLPESASGTFAEAFSPRNIDHFELITGGIPAEYGERLAAVMNIVTKTGPETPGGSVELNYGSYNTFSPQAILGGSTSSGDLHYYFSANYHRTDRGLDTPQPKSTTDNTQGGKDAIHDFNDGNSEFGKLDWILDNENKLSFILFHSYNRYQIPNFPTSFDPHDPYFDPSSSFEDPFGNSGFGYRLAATDDAQTNRDAYLQAVWRHTFSERSFLQVAPYWKYSSVGVSNDPPNDLAPGDPANTTYFNVGNNATSFTLNQHINNEGLKVDYSLRPNDRNLVKTGVQLQATQSHDTYSIASWAPNESGTQTFSSFGGGDDDTGTLEAAYLQDDFQICKPLSLNVGLRFTAVQFHFEEGNSNFDQWQPRIGLNFMATDSTKLHVFYGRLFMPAPLENLRTAFNHAGAGGATTPSFYDIKPEKDNYYEVGIDQQLAQTHVTSLNVYYKTATDMLDDTQLLNTSIASPYNFAVGYAYGVEYSLRGKLTPNLADYFTYSFEVAKGKGNNGGTFSLDPDQIPRDSYIYLDHVQIHTANAGLTYSTDRWHATVQGQFGSGLRTGENNSKHLPDHFSFDLSGGYNITGESWWTRWTVSGDILNLFDNVYPISIANGFNGSHFVAGREFFVRLSKEL